jgi:hypothetical protein
MSIDSRSFRFYDDHLHLPTADDDGLDRLLRHVDAHPEMVGGNLILNTEEEVAFVEAHLDRLPLHLTLVPYYPFGGALPPAVTTAGWYKIHPVMARLTKDDIPAVCEALRDSPSPPKGLIVHHYPWGADLGHEISLPLIIALARALPATPIVATHGGGYESWPLRAHTGSLPNVLYDFAVTMSYSAGSDVLRPFQVYLNTRPHRLLFGSDWPSAEPRPQLAECLRLAEEARIHAPVLEAALLENAARLWPTAQTALRVEVDHA